MSSWLIAQRKPNSARMQPRNHRDYQDLRGALPASSSDVPWLQVCLIALGASAFWGLVVGRFDGSPPLGLKGPQVVMPHGMDRDGQSGCLFLLLFSFRMEQSVHILSRPSIGKVVRYLRGGLIYFLPLTVPNR
jgi:hypothetical protein